MKALPRIALKTVAISAGIIGIALLIAQDQQTLRIRSVHGAEDERFPDYAAAIVGSPVTGVDRYEMLVNGDRLFPAMLQAIAQAKRRISFETYIYTDGKIADRFTEAFVAAAKRGVLVTIVVDAVGSKYLSQRHVEALRAAGCEVGWFNPLTWHSLEEVNYRTHRKILVIDGEVGFTGGIGIADYWAGDALDPEQWRDTQFKVTGPAARLLEGAFYENLIETGGVATPLLDVDWAPKGGGGRSIVALSSPSGGSNGMKRLYLLSIAAARKTLDISSPYFVTDESSDWVIEEAVKRGVKIRLLVEGEITDAKPVKFASRERYERLLELGVEVYEYEPTMMHAKSMVVDSAWNVIGSANFDNRSFELNDELNLGVADRQLARQITEQFERDLSVSRRLDLESWRRRPFWEKAREHFWSFFGEIF